MTNIKAVKIECVNVSAMIKSLDKKRDRFEMIERVIELLSNSISFPEKLNKLLGEWD